MNDLFEKRREKMRSLRTKRDSQFAKAETVVEVVPKPLWTCPKCGVQSEKRLLSTTLLVCPHCAHHLPMGAYARLFSLLDHGSFRELDAPSDDRINDPLAFPHYAEKVQQLRESTGLHDGIVTATGKIGGHKTAIAVMDSRFLMGSMGTALGERFTRLVEHATRYKLPLIVFTASGGARMQEGIYSLMQMAKTSAAIARFSQAGGLFVVVYTHPTTGGVSASFAALGDITLAEPQALIGFAGQRVIEQTIGEKLPEGFQRAEFQLAHGFVDQIVDRRQMQAKLQQILTLHRKVGGA